ncbi:hypothetical protein [Burkholderia sp. Ac-20365]|uniref:hypothetical protein n=1 Tax=Burkholderia sp. Ac-20365 TaxID=2703897 RepID=UPI00197CAADB|nr:hypothetical protein [Burkholderia sp. Ac-20365]MBN3761309.1 hypothetical protein [Burkholderia sp. Ac-20365]
MNLATIFGSEGATLRARARGSRPFAYRYVVGGASSTLGRELATAQLGGIGAFFHWYGNLPDEVVDDLGADCTISLLTLFDREARRLKKSTVDLQVPGNGNRRSGSPRVIKVYSRRTIRWITRNLYFTERVTSRSLLDDDGRGRYASWLDELGARVDWAKDAIRSHAGIGVSPECVAHRGYASIELNLSEPLMEEIITILLEWDALDVVLRDNGVDRDDQTGVSAWIAKSVMEPLAWMRLGEPVGMSRTPILRPSAHIRMGEPVPEETAEGVITALKARRDRGHAGRSGAIS